MPALLAPLELLEDLIPIFGEIADIAEIAATPAIIQGCVKGIEKEGKAEFKVFGKEHTLSFDAPKTKPTDVPDRPPAKSDTPTKTGDKNNPTCTRKAEVAKRAPAAPTKTNYIDSGSFKILASTVKAIPNAEWRDGQGWAIEASKFPSFLYSVREKKTPQWVLPLNFVTAKIPFRGCNTDTGALRMASHWCHPLSRALPAHRWIRHRLNRTKRGPR